ncbi:MAG: 50S ribosomal protein L10 [Candidatus Vogelbacteria bacterium RIFOXYD1_FULL_44_32]|uniref:Large ribosomal subunit protein uL10 n=1 Tax=Candidatus Vogelbacteria bacterium RIFOXYD1_FULL_44_32 TaxID=1802438 RepID=A0A1G2QEF2_9BACT|nr:MAG: 50S ribosomal protein L10 [Candidatus Vogelbacteria bacterium RIFOXYD1_FULL_44_32]
MALSREKKSIILTQLKGVAKEAKSITFVNFHGLTVTKADELRKSLRLVGVGYAVAKKTLVRMALGGVNIAGELPNLPGEIAVAYSTSDLLAPAKGVYDFGKKYPNTVSIVGGVFEGKFMDEGTMVAIAKIPGREILLGQLANMLNWPIQGLVIALDQIALAKESK